VGFVAKEGALEQALGAKGKRGMLKSMPSRAASLAQPTPKIVFHYTLKDASWLNQIELGVEHLDP
jgi:putative transposase